MSIELNSRATSIAGNGAVKSVVLADGRELPADLVVIGIGVIPNTELAEAAGARSSDGVVVDEYCRTSLADFYAAGDVTSHYNPILGRRVRLESWQNAQNQAIAAARNMLGARSPTPRCRGSGPTSTTAISSSPASSSRDWRSSGAASARARHGVRPAGGQVRLAVGFNAGSELRFARRLVELAARVPVKSLADPSVKLKELLPEAAPRSLAV